MIQSCTLQVLKLVKKKIHFPEETLENCVERTMEWSRLFIIGFITVCVHISLLLIFIGFMKAFSAHFHQKRKKQTKNFGWKIPAGPTDFCQCTPSLSYPGAHFL